MTGPISKLEFLDFTKLANAMAINSISKQGFVIWPYKWDTVVATVSISSATQILGQKYQPTVIVN